MPVRPWRRQRHADSGRAPGGRASRRGLPWAGTAGFRCPGKWPRAAAAPETLEPPRASDETRRTRAILRPYRGTVVAPTMSCRIVPRETGVLDSPEVASPRAARSRPTADASDTIGHASAGRSTLDRMRLGRRGGAGLALPPRGHHAPAGSAANTAHSRDLRERAIAVAFEMSARWRPRLGSDREVTSCSTWNRAAREQNLQPCAARASRPLGLAHCRDAAIVAVDGACTWRERHQPRHGGPGSIQASARGSAIRLESESAGWPPRSPEDS